MYSPTRAKTTEASAEGPKPLQIKKSQSADGVEGVQVDSDSGSSSSVLVAPSSKYKTMPETGDCAVSPVIAENGQEATGYYTGNQLATFTTAALIPRLERSKTAVNDAPKPAEFNFHVAGRFHALNRWSQLTITPIPPTRSKQERKKSERGITLYKFSLLPNISGKAAQQLGDDIANTWVAQNRTFLCMGSEEAMLKTGQIQGVISKRHIKVISPRNIDLYARFHQPTLSDGETSLIVNVHHLHKLFNTNSQQAVEYFAKIIAYYRHGQTLIQTQSESIDELLQDTGLTQILLNDLHEKIGVAMMPALPQEALGFLAAAIGIDAQGFNYALERYENELRNPSSTDKKTEQDKLAVFTYAKVFLSVDVFFGKKTIPFIDAIKEQGIIVNPEASNLSKTQKITDSEEIIQLICQDYHAKTLFALADAVGFCFFPNNDVLYACPTAMDKIQPQMIDLIKHLFGITIKFPVEYEEIRVRQRSATEESIGSSGSSSTSSQLPHPSLTDTATSTTPNNNELQIDHAAMLADFKTFAYDAMVEACSPKGFYNVYLALGMLNKIIDWYKIAITALSKTDITLTQEEVLSVNASFWRSIQKIAEQFKEQNYPDSKHSTSAEALWLGKVIATAQMHLGDPGKYAQATVFATTTNMDAWSRHIKEQRYSNNGKDVQFKTQDNVPYARNAAFEDNVAQAHAQFAYFSISKEHRKHANALSALERITDSYGSLLETSTPYTTPKK